MTRPSAIGRAIRDSMLVGWLLVGSLTLAVVFSIRAGVGGWWTAIAAVLAVPVVVHIWARALCRLESGVPKGIRTPVTAVKGRCPRPLDDGDVLIETVVEPGGIEPPTSCMPCKRSPS